MAMKTIIKKAFEIILKQIIAVKIHFITAPFRCHLCIIFKFNMNVR